MTNKEAIKLFERRIETNCKGSGILSADMRRWNMAYRMAIDALKKG